MFLSFNYHMIAKLCAVVLVGILKEDWWLFVPHFEAAIGEADIYVCSVLVLLLVTVCRLVYSESSEAIAV